MNFVKNELKKLETFLGQEYPECSATLRDDDQVVGGEEEERQRGSSRDAFLKITINFLKQMKQEQLADCLQSSKMVLRMA